MHELSLARGLITEIQKAAVKEHAHKVTLVRLVIGPCSGIEREAFELAFPLAAEGTLMEAAVLITEDPPISVRCRNCEAITTPPTTNIACQKCKSYHVDILNGREFCVKSIDLEVDE